VTARYGGADADASSGHKGHDSDDGQVRTKPKQPQKEAADDPKHDQKHDQKHDRKANRLRETRIEKMMSKAELARRANLSVLTIDRVEKGLGCRMDTKRKILEALGLSLADRVRVFGEEE
jgi:ribosome-binding protein aMBF1 (putative translation factor)